MAGSMLRCPSSRSASPARPERAAVPRRLMFSEDGGVGTTSSSVRRARLSFGVFTVVFTLLVRFFAAFRADRADRFAARGLGRLTERAFEVRALPRFAFWADLGRRAPLRFAMAITSFRTLTVCR